MVYDTIVRTITLDKQPLMLYTHLCKWKGGENMAKSNAKEIAKATRRTDRKQHPRNSR
jgi:hypothetical protein